MRDVTKLFYILIICLSCNLCRSYKILVVFPMAGRSHATLGKACVQLLLTAGHEVTYIKWGSDYTEQHQNLTVIDIAIPIPLVSRYSLKQMLNGEVDLNNIHQFSTIMSDLQRKILEHDKVVKLVTDPNKSFDVAVLEWIYGEYITGLPAILGCPYVWLSTMEPHSLILSLIGEITNPAYTAMNNFKSIPPFSFIERLRSLKDQTSIYLYREFYLRLIEEEHYEKFVAPLIAKRQGVVPPYNALRYNASLVLGNSHISVGRTMTLPQAYIAVGGYHVDKNTDPLPKDLKILMDKSSNGVIYFSLGSFFNSKDLPLETIGKLVKIFSDLKQTVLWKFEEDLPNRPKNVHIVSWAPQQKILAHPNCVLFISHGGQLSMLEAVHYGVPIIGVSVFVDQHTNVKTLVKSGMAQEVNIFNLAEDLKGAIDEILGNPRYTRAAKFQSFIYHDRLVPPGEEMVFWVEHVVKTKGAAHLRSISLILPWYQKSYLDLAVVVIIVFSLLRLTVKRLLVIMSKKRSDVKKKQ